MDLAPLEAVLPPRSLVVDPDLLTRYSHDLTGRFSGRPAAVARPATVDEVAALLRACSDAGIGVVPQGGNTGLVGGAIADGGEVVLSLERLTHVGRPDASTRTVDAKAGASLHAVQGAAARHALELPIDFAARGSATIGGMVATDAGGSLVMRHGTMRDLVAGLQAVLAGGTVIDHLARPSKDSSGFDVTSLMCGSEGTLGIVTAARLALVRAPAHRLAALVALGSLEDAVALTAALRAEVESLEAVDFFLARGLRLVTAHARLAPPFGSAHEAFVMVSCAAPYDPAEELGAALARRTEVLDAAVGQAAAQREALWSYRELHNEAIAAAGIPHKLDVAVAPARVPELIERIDRWLHEERPEANAIHYGHLADGNVHVNVLGAGPEDDAVDEAVLGIVAAMGGSISAEHGIGRAKTRWLHLTRPAEEIAAMRAVKRALDPRGILNPGKLLPPDGAVG